MSETEEKKRVPKVVWRDMRKAHEHLECKVLEILRHPEATSEQLLEVARVYRDSYKKMCAAQEAMLSKFGNYGGVIRFNEEK